MSKPHDPIPDPATWCREKSHDDSMWPCTLPAGHKGAHEARQPMSGKVLDKWPQYGSDHDPVNAPAHYRSHPSGVECIQITEHFGFNIGNVIKYLWRAEEKGAPIEDLRKAAWYLDREIEKREAASLDSPTLLACGCDIEQSHHTCPEADELNAER